MRIYYQVSRVAPSNNITKFIKKRNTPKMLAGIVYHMGMANSFMMFGLDANLIKGTRANGN